MDDTIRVERDGFIATVVLDRPQKLNALTKAMWRTLGATIDALGYGMTFALLAFLHPIASYVLSRHVTASRACTG